MYECFHCGQRAVLWDGDFDSEDYGWTISGIVHDLHCTNCGAIIQYMIPTDDDEMIGGTDE